MPTEDVLEVHLARADDHVPGATSPVVRRQDLGDLREPHAWVDTAQGRLRELDARLVRKGWERRDSAPRAHRRSLVYSRKGVPCAPDERT